SCRSSARSTGSVRRVHPSRRIRPRSDRRSVPALAPGTRRCEEKVMAERDLWDERRRSHEAGNIQRRESEAIEKMRGRAHRPRARTRELAEQYHLGHATGISDDEILKELHDLGYTQETVILAHLVPLLQVAWIDGSVSGPERAGILEAARLRGVEENTPAYRQ